MFTSLINCGENQGIAKVYPGWRMRRVYSAWRAEYTKGTFHFFSLLHIKRTLKEPVTRFGCFVFFLHNYTKKKKTMLLYSSFRHMPQYTIEKLDY